MSETCNYLMVDDDAARMEKLSTLMNFVEIILYLREFRWRKNIAF